MGVTASRLRRVDWTGPGLSRRRRGRGFEIVDRRGRHVSNGAVLERVRALGIPPAWTDVWICPHEHGHLQAVGVDAAGRRQYLYHPRWRARRDQQKFDRMLMFARLLPQLRARAARDLELPGLGRKRVLACAVRLLDVGFFRIGGESYASRNGSFGLATLQRRHVRVAGQGRIVFDYPAKSGQRRIQSVVDEDVSEVIRALKRRRSGGDALLAYRREEDGAWVDVRSSEINAYIKETDPKISAKDFRTWHANLLAATALAVSAWQDTQTGREKAIKHAVQEAAHYLGNTPAVCRASYIDPRLFDHYRSGNTVAAALQEAALEDSMLPGETVERALIELLEEPPSRVS